MQPLDFRTPGWRATARYAGGQLESPVFDTREEAVAWGIALLNADVDRVVTQGVLIGRSGGESVVSSE